MADTRFVRRFKPFAVFRLLGSLIDFLVPGAIRVLGLRIFRRIKINNIRVFLLTTGLLEAGARRVVIVSGILQAENPQAYIRAVKEELEDGRA